MCGREKSGQPTERGTVEVGFPQQQEVGSLNNQEVGFLNKQEVELLKDL